MNGLVPLALRVTLQSLIRNQTSAAGYVSDAPAQPEDLLAARVADMGNPLRNAPMIGIFTPFAGRAQQDRDSGGKANGVNVAIWVYTPPEIIRIADGFDWDVSIRGFAAALDLVAAQIRQAILFGPAEWRAIYEDLLIRSERSIGQQVMLEAANGMKIPALKILIRAGVVPEPDFGKPLSGAWLKFDSALRVDPQQVAHADFIKALIEAPPGLGAWRREQAAIPVSEPEMRALGLAPLDATASGTENASLLDQLTNSGETIVDHPGFPENLP